MTVTERLQRCMTKNGMEDQSSYDHCKRMAWICYLCILTSLVTHIVLSADDASLLAMEFNKNPIINDEDSFDIFPSCVTC